MPDPLHINRRELLAMSLAAGCTALYSPFVVSQSNADSAEISNRFLSARFDLHSGFLQASLADKSPLLIDAAVRAVSPSWTLNSCDTGLKRKARTQKIQDSLGAGEKIIIECFDPSHRIILVVEISLYDHRYSLFVEAILRNDSSQNILVQKLEPLRATGSDTGICAWPHAARCLTNGYLYADPGIVVDMSQTRTNPQKSFWNIGFSGKENAPGLTAGFVEGDFATGTMETSLAAYKGQDGLTLSTEAFLNTECILKPAQFVRSGRFALQIAENPYTALEQYAQAMGDAHQVKLNPVLNGWCNWYYSHTNTSESEILKNAEFAARHLKPYGLEWIQIDDGYQRAFSDWEGNENFPHGMKWLAQQIRALGLRPGLWIAPYVISEGTDVYKNHPDWLIRNLDGTLRHCGDRGSTKLYGLDISISAAAAWFRELLRTVTEDWGYDFIKIDFVEWTILAAERYHDPSWSRAVAYRKGAGLIREAIGPNRHLLDCGPSQMAVGLFDSTRIELDQPFLTWEQYIGNFNSNAPAIAKRYYFHGRTWINDADHLGIGLLTRSQGEAAASIIALSGGTMISGDRLIELDEERLGILQKVFPSFGVAARPVDLFDSGSLSEKGRPELFILPVKTPFEEWFVAGLFNFDPKETREKSITLSRLGLDPQQHWLAFEFWQQRFLGKIRNELRVLVPPESIALVALRRDRGVPQVLSTNRHFTQGAIELRDVAWNPADNTLSGTSLAGKGTHHNLLIHVPPNYAMGPKPDSPYFQPSSAPEMPHDFENYSVTLLPSGLARISLNFNSATQIPWRLSFTRS